MTKGQLLASIIMKLRGKQNAYTIDSIIESMSNDSKVKDLVFDLKNLGALEQIKEVTRDMGDIVGIQFYYTLSPFYVQSLEAAAQTESIKECIEIVNHIWEHKVEQIELFK